MGPINQDFNSPMTQFLNQWLQGENQGGLTGDMIHQDQSSARRNFAENRFDRLFWGLNGKGNLSNHNGGSALLGNKVQGIAGGIVFVIGREQFIPRTEGERSQNGVDSGSGIRQEGNVGSISPHKLRQGRAGGIQ
jgi:hypothetical protein